MPDKPSDNREQQVADFIVDLASMFSRGVIGETKGDPGPGRATSIPHPERVDGRTIAAYELALDLAAQATVPEILRRLVDGAREIVDARYGALVFRLQDALEATVLLSGSLPGTAPDGVTTDSECLVTGRNMPEAPMLVRDLDDPALRSRMPEGHAKVGSLVGAPLHVNDQQVGYLFQIDKTGGETFDDGDYEALQLLTRHACAAIGRAQAERGLAMGQHRIETQLSQLRTIMDTLPAGVLVLAAPDGSVELANETALRTILGEQHDRTASLRIYRDFEWLRADETELPRSQHPGMLALKGERIGNRGLTLETKSGKRLPVRVQSTPIYNQSGEVTRAVVLFLDVSRERAAEQVKDDFLSLISHEFRTPLTAIHGGALLLTRAGEGLDPETRQELLHDIGEESLRLDRMLGNLLSVSQIMAGRFQAETEPILVAPLVQPLIEEFRERSPAHTFTMDVEPDVPPAEGTPELSMQVFRNLYENAVKYSPGGGEIRTVIRRRDTWVMVEVIDQGLGIAAEHVPHVFERFRRPGAEPTVRGMGLGLYLSRLLVDAQGGHVSASSPGPGKGATFVVELPTVPDWEREHDTGIESE